MPKEAFYTWSGPEPHRKIFEIRWAKETDVDPAKTVIYLPPLPAETPDGVFEMIANGGDTETLDRLIAALQRAKRAMLGTTTGVDTAVDELVVKNVDGDVQSVYTRGDGSGHWNHVHGFGPGTVEISNAARGGAGAAPGRYEDEV